MDLTTGLLLVTAVAGAPVALIVFRAAPRLSFTLWAVVLFFVPMWVGISVGFFWPLITVVTGLLIISQWTLVRLSVVDLVVAVFVLLVAAFYVLGLVSRPETVTALQEWILFYILGRLVLARVGRRFVVLTVSLLAVAAAVLALVEFVTGVNVFVLIPGRGAAYDVWATLQDRGGFLRVEGAFGHSIALGAVLAMSSAFVMITRWKLLLKLAALVVIAAAIVVTFSRIGLATFVITVTLGLALLPHLTTRGRLTIAAAGALSLGLVVPFVSATLAGAGEEAAGSAGYRTDLLAALPVVQWFGGRPDWADTVAGETYLGFFARSVDNAMLLVALRFGWVATALVALLLCLVLLGLRRGKINPATVALAGQLPAFVTVALITQYGMMVWFLGGLAVSWASGDGAAAPPSGERAAEREPATRTGVPQGHVVRSAEPVTA